MTEVWGGLTFNGLERPQPEHPDTYRPQGTVGMYASTARIAGRCSSPLCRRMGWCISISTPSVGCYA